MANPNIYALSDHRWSVAGTTYNGIWLNVDNGAAGLAVGAAASRLFKLTNNNTTLADIDLNGVMSLLTISNDPNLQYSAIFQNLQTNIAGFRMIAATGGSPWEIRFRTNQPGAGWFEICDSGNNIQHRWNTKDYLLANTGILGWSSESTFATSGVGARDIGLQRDAAGFLGQHNSTNAQKLGIYNTADATGVPANYERFSIDWTKFSNIVSFGPENAGTGSARATMWQTTALTLASLPTAASAGSGARMYISNCTAPVFGATAVGGGTTPMVVYSDAVQWKVG